MLAIAPIGMLIVARPTREGVLIGLPFVIVGEAVRLWAAGHVTKLARLVTAGPYALCRNPMYAGMFLICVGYFVMCGRLDVWIVGSALFWLFHGGAVLCEEKMLRARFGEQYDDYCRRVGRFWPRWRGIAGEGAFSWRRLVANKEHVALAMTVAMCAFFVVNAYWSDSSPLRWLASIRP